MTIENNTPQYGRSDQVDLFEFAGDLWQQKWVILGVTLLFCLCALAYVLLATPVYQASVRTIPPSGSDVVPFNVGRSQAGLTELDVEGAYALFQRHLTSRSTRRWFLEEYYQPYRRQQDESVTREEMVRELTEVLVVTRPDERNSPTVYEVTVSIDDPELSAHWANSYVEGAAGRARSNLEVKTLLEVANRRTELQHRIDVLRSSTLDQRKDRIARLKEALEVAEAVGFDAPQVTRGQTAADGDLAQIIDGSLLYMRGSRAIRAELELLEARENDDPFISELRALEQNISLLKLIDLVPESVQLVTIDSFAEIPVRPSKPKKAMILVFGTLLGGMLGGLIAFVRVGLKYRNAQKARFPVQA